MDPDERDSVATLFGVSAEQVERDHFISHVLAFLSRDFGDRVHFIGGTALARTHLPDGRLSEDIDLIAVGSRKDVANALDATLPRRRATGAHSACVRGVEDGDMGRPTRAARPLGPLGAEQARRHRRGGGRTVSATRTHQQESGGAHLQLCAVGRTVAGAAGRPDAAARLRGRRSHESARGLAAGITTYTNRHER